MFSVFILKHFVTVSFLVISSAKHFYCEASCNFCFEKCNINKYQLTHLQNKKFVRSLFGPFFALVANIFLFLPIY